MCVVAIQMGPGGVVGSGTSSGGMVAPIHQLPPSHLAGSHGKSLANTVSCVRLSEKYVDNLTVLLIYSIDK